MPDQSSLNITNVTGNITFGSGHVAGGHVVMGNKTTTTTSTVQNGFKGEEDKLEFQAKLDQFAKTLQQMQKLLEIEDGISDADKQSIAAEVAKQVTASVELKRVIASAPAGAPAPAPVAEQVNKVLEGAGGFVKKIEAVVEKAGPTAETVLSVTKKALPILLAARGLFGIP
jgi:uncharacterized protein YukE